MFMVLRSLAECIAEYLAADPFVTRRGGVSVIVEDRGNVAFQAANALAGTGVAVIVGVTGWDRRSQSAGILTGTAKIEVRVVENPMSRDDSGTATAQDLAEHFARVLHWRMAPGLVNGPIRLEGFSRDDTEEANVTSMNFLAEVSLGLSQKENKE